MAYEIGEQPRRDVPFEVYIGDAVTAERYAQAEWASHDAVWLLRLRESLLNDYEHFVALVPGTRRRQPQLGLQPDGRVLGLARSQAWRRDARSTHHSAGHRDHRRGTGSATRRRRARDALRSRRWRDAAPLPHLANGAVHGEQTFGLRLSSYMAAADEIPFTCRLAARVFRQQIDFPIRPYVGAGITTCASRTASAAMPSTRR